MARGAGTNPGGAVSVWAAFAGKQVGGTLLFYIRVQYNDIFVKLLVPISV